MNKEVIFVFAIGCVAVIGVIIVAIFTANYDRRHDKLNEELSECRNEVARKDLTIQSLYKNLDSKERIIDSLQSIEPDTIRVEIAREPQEDQCEDGYRWVKYNKVTKYTLKLVKCQN